jgi:hypothetical protein
MSEYLTKEIERLNNLLEKAKGTPPCDLCKHDKQRYNALPCRICGPQCPEFEERHDADAVLEAQQ